MPTISSTIAAPLRVATSRFTEPRPTFWTDLSEDERVKCRGPASALSYKDKTAWNIEDCLLIFWECKVLPAIMDVCNDDNNKAWTHRGHKVQILWSTVLYLLGPATAPKQAKPTVFVLSSSSSFNRKSASLIRKHATVANLQHGFDIIGHKEPVIWQAGAGFSDGSGLLKFGGGNTLCGSRIMSVPFGAVSASERRNATIGGIIKVGGLYHGVTVAHIFMQGSAIPDDTSDSSNNSGTEDQFEEASLYSSQENESEPDEATSFHAYSIHLDPGQTTNPVTQNDDVVPNDLGLASAFLGNMVVPPSHLHTTKQDELPYTPGFPPHINRDLDWALVEIRDRRHMVPNVIARSSSGIVTVSSVMPLNSPPRGEILVGGGALNALSAYGHGASIGLALPGSRRLQSMWTVEYKCAAGQCGAWVVCPLNGKLYGMVFAAIPGLGLTCLVPAETVFKDIQKRWKDETRDLSDILPGEVASATEALRASIVGAYGPAHSDSRPLQAGRQSDHDSHTTYQYDERSLEERAQTIANLSPELETLKEKTILADANNERVLTSFRFRCTAAEESLMRLEQERVDLKTKLLISEDKLHEQEKSLKSHANALGVSSRPREDLEQRLSGLEQELGDLKQVRSDLEQQLSDQSQKAASRQAKLTDEINHLNKEVAVLQTQVAASRIVRGSGIYSPVTSVSTSRDGRDSWASGPSSTRSRPSIAAEEATPRRRPSDAASDRRDLPRLKPGSDRDFWIPEAGISREVIMHDIIQHLGQDTLVRPGKNDKGQPGYLITAYRPPTTEMIRSMKEASEQYSREMQSRHSRPAAYSSSTTVFVQDKDFSGGIESYLGRTSRRRLEFYDSDDSMDDAPPLKRHIHDQRELNSRMMTDPREMRPPRQMGDSRDRDPRDTTLADPRLQDPRLQDPRLQDPRLQDPRLQDPRLQDPRLQDPRLQDPRLQVHRDPRHQDPRETLVGHNRHSEDSPAYPHSANPEYRQRSVLPLHSGLSSPGRLPSVDETTDTSAAAGRHSGLPGKDPRTSR